MTMQSIILAQALDLRGVKLTGTRSSAIYDGIRRIVPFVGRDQSLGPAIQNLRERFKEISATRGTLESL